MLSGATPTRGRAFVYIAACSGPEDILKVGLSVDPLARWSAFHRRWFEAFDLEQSLLVECETRRDAQRMETALHRLLRAHNCPPPLTMRERFGGATEWYRGAHARVLAFAEAAAAQGHVLHAPAAAWFATALRGCVDVLAGVLDQARRDAGAGLLTPAQREAVRDLVDAFAAFDEDVRERFAAELAVLGGCRRSRQAASPDAVGPAAQGRATRRN